jgi:hypothetical protein
MIRGLCGLTNWSTPTGRFGLPRCCRLDKLRVGTRPSAKLDRTGRRIVAAWHEGAMGLGSARIRFAVFNLNTGNGCREAPRITRRLASSRHAERPSSSTSAR